MRILIALLFLTLMGIEAVRLLRQKMYGELAVALVLYLLAMIPAIILPSGRNKVPAVNTIIRLLVKRMVGK
ncbi:MAG: hypothetical protein ACOX2K_12240 [Bacillota bacterium]|jgi:hypothetical protein